MAKVVSILTLICWLNASPADACSFLIRPHTVDEAEQKVDTRAPDPVVAEVDRIVRGRGPVRRPDGSVGPMSSCDDIGSIEVTLVHFLDDRTPGDELGYRVTLVDGTLPERFGLPEGVFLPRVEAERAPRFVLIWIDGARDDQEPFDFTFVVTAVDLAGNESPPSAPIRASHPGS